MTITQPPESAESIHPENTSPSALLQLAERGVMRYFTDSDPNRIKMLKILDNGKKSEFQRFLTTDIKNALVRERNFYGKKDPRSNISDKDIEEYVQDQSMMRRIILDETVARRSLEHDTFRHLQNRFRGHDILGKQTLIREILRSLDEKDLYKIVRDKTFARGLLETNGISSLEDQKINDIISDLQLPATITTDNMVMEQLQYFLDTGKISFVDVHFLITRYGPNFTESQKKTVLAYFLPSISLNDLEVLGLITPEQKKKLALGQLEQLLTESGNLVPPTTLEQYLGLNSEIQAEVESWSQGELHHQIAVSDLDDATINNFLSRDAADMLATSLRSPAYARLTPQVSSFSELKILLKTKLKKNGECLIENIDELQQGSYIQSSRLGRPAYWKVVSSQAQSEEGTPGMEIQQFNEYGQGGSVVFVEYHEFFDALKKEQQDSQGVRVTNEIPPHIQETQSEYPFVDAPSFIEWLGQIDAENKLIGFEKGVSFSLMIDGELGVYTVESINPANQTFVLHDKYGDVVHRGMPNLTFQQFYTFLSQQGDYFEFNRLGKFDTLAEFTENVGIPGIFMSGGDMMMKVDGQKGEQEKKVWGFQNEEGQYIQAEFHGEKVVLYEYTKRTPLELDEEIRKDKKKKEKELKKLKRKEYFPQTLGWFYHYLKSNKFNQPLAEDPTQEKVAQMEHDAASHEYHEHGRGFFGVLSGLKTFGDLKKAVEMGGHMFTHMLEEQQQVHSAELLYKFFLKTRGPNAALTLHALQVFSGAVGKLIDEKVSYLKRIGAGARRKEIRHILSVRPQKPYLLLAAMIVTVEGAGHLYPDSHLQEIQGNRYLWFESLCASLGYDYQTELRKAQEKEGAFNAETMGHLNEVTLITRFLKTNSEKDEYIQAIGAGAKFWKAADEGRNSQIEKGKKESSGYLGAMDRAEYAISKLKSNEPEIFVGAFEQAYGKDPGAKVLGIAFVYTLSGFPATAHPDVSNQMKNFLDAKGVAFHGIPFSRNASNAALYEDVVSLVIAKSGNTSMQNAWKMVQGETKKGKYVEQSAKAVALWDFWKTYHREIHNILQLSDPTLYTLREDPTLSDVERSRVKDYIMKMGGIFDEGRLNDSKPDETIMKQGGYRLNGGSMIPDMDKDGTKSVNRILHYIDTNSHNGTMPNKIQFNNLWRSQIIAYLQSMRTNQVFLEHPEYQKSQFIKIHDEILSFLREKFTVNHYQEMLKQPYMTDLDNLGFDISEENIFQDTHRLGHRGALDFGGQAAYERFREHRTVYSVQSRTSIGTEAVLGAVRPDHQAANDRSYRRAA